jgi:hypothetical protein
MRSRSDDSGRLVSYPEAIALSGRISPAKSASRHQSIRGLT